MRSVIIGRRQYEPRLSRHLATAVLAMVARARMAPPSPKVCASPPGDSERYRRPPRGDAEAEHKALVGAEGRQASGPPPPRRV